MRAINPLGPGAANRFAPLDGYRAMACLVVVVAHTAEGLGVVEDHPVLGANFIGYFAVVVLFTMSGFLVYRPFVARHLDDRPAPSTGRFFWQRLLRIYPLYWVVVTVYLLQGHQDVPGLWGYIRVYGLFQIYTPGTFGRGILAAWTLAVDISFYLVVPLLALAAQAAGRRLGHGRRARLKGEILVVASFTLIGPLWRCFWLLRGPTRLVDIWLPSQTDFFGLGMGFAVASAWAAQGGTIPRPVSWLARRPTVCFLFALELFWLLGQLHLPLARINPIGDFRVTPSDQMARYALYAGAAFLVFTPALFGRQTAASNRVMGSRPLRVMSELSFGIYLWHVLFLSRAADWLGGRAEAGFWPTLYIGLVLSSAAAGVTYLAVEKPSSRLRDLGHRPSRPHAGSRPVPTTPKHAVRPTA